jgi:hypothetical protein
MAQDKLEPRNPSLDEKFHHMLDKGSVHKGEQWRRIALIQGLHARADALGDNEGDHRVTPVDGFSKFKVTSLELRVWSYEFGVTSLECLIPPWRDKKGKIPI